MKLASPASRVISYVNGSVPGYLCYLQLFAKMKKKKNLIFFHVGRIKIFARLFCYPKEEKIMIHVL